MLNLHDLEMLIGADGGVLSDPDNPICANLEELGLVRYWDDTERWRTTTAGRDVLVEVLVALNRQVCR